MKGKCLISALFFLTVMAYSQQDNNKSNDPLVATIQTEKTKTQSQTLTTLGLGFGLDYGFLGTNLTLYPTSRIGLFGGAGILPMEGSYFMYNAGVKINFTRKSSFYKWGFEAMYGTNTFVQVENQSDLNKLFPGATLGIYSENIRNKFTFSFGLLWPIRSSEVDDYVEDHGLIVDYGWPIKISVGINFIL